jgi:hypothetical protein
MCKILSLKVNHNNCKDSFKISLDNRKKIEFEFDKTYDTVNGIVNELVITIDENLNIEQLKKDMNILLKSKRIYSIYYE